MHITKQTFSTMKLLLACITLTTTAPQSDYAVRAFTTASSHRRITKPQPLITLHHQPSSPPSSALYGLFDDEDPLYQESEIPPELKDEIFAAEAKTEAAQGRNQRVITYILLTVVGVTTAFFNAFLSDLRFGDGSPSSDLAYYGFGWVQSNPLTGFLFTNKIGGALGLLSAGLSGTLAEVEIRSKKENVSKIWTEMQRRKVMKERPTKSSKKKNKRVAQSSKRDMTGKQKKRMSALEELMEPEEPQVAVIEQPPVVEQQTATPESQDTEVDQSATTSSEESEGGIFGKIKGFYDKADSMAASQALLLNKELEDRGVIDKITDETGLKVVGKEAAAKLSEKKTEDD